MFKEYTRLLRFVKPHINMLVFAVLSMVVCSLMGSVSLGMIIPFVDKVISGKDIALSANMQLPQALNSLVTRLNSMNSVSLLKILMIAGFFLFLIRQVFEYLKAYFMNELGYRFVKDIRDAIYDNMLKLSLDFFHKNPTGKLTAKILFDTAIIKEALIEGLTDLLYQPIELLFYLCAIIVVKIYFGIPVGLVVVSLAFTLLIIYPVVRIGRRIRKITMETQETVADINTTIFEAITGISIVNAFSMQEYELNRLKSQNAKYYKTAMKSIKRMIAITPMTEFITMICVGVVLWVGGRSVVTNNLSAGAFITFLAALLSLLKPFKRLSKVHATSQQAFGAAMRVFEVLDAKPKVFEKPDAVRLPEFRDNITYEGIFFKYEEEADSDFVLKDINMTIKRGEIAAFVGPSGVGKTTLLNLLPRFYDPQRGAVKIDGVNIKDAALKSFRDQVGIVTQEAILFNDTVAQNIAYGTDVKANKDAIVKAAKAANCHNFIMNMPKGYETVIGERGFRLSGGEKQRLCIARAIFKNPPVLILDEATSQLDTESEILVQEAIDNLMTGRTVLVIAHRLSTVKHATRIYVLEKGKIVESGSHDDLIARSGLYNKLYNLQFNPKFM